MTKRLIDLDDELLALARRELNTTGVSDTVRAALRQAGSAAARARQVAWLREGGLERMTDPTQRADVWRGSPGFLSTPTRRPRCGEPPARGGRDPPSPEGRWAPSPP